MVWCAAFAVLVLLPLYCVLGHFYGTLTHQYAWVASAAYLSGRAAAAWEMALWLVLMCVVLVLFVRKFPTSAEGTVLKKMETSSISRLTYAYICIAFTSINLIVAAPYTI